MSSERTGRRFRLAWPWSPRKSSKLNKEDHPEGIEINNFSFRGAKLWDKLPNNIKSVSCKDLFKRKVKQWLRAEALKRDNNEYLFY